MEVHLCPGEHVPLVLQERDETPIMSPFLEEMPVFSIAQAFRSVCFEKLIPTNMYVVAGWVLALTGTCFKSSMYTRKCNAACGRSVVVREVVRSHIPEVEYILLEEELVVV